MVNIRKFGFQKETFDRSPTGVCGYCKKEMPINQLREIYYDPATKGYICEKCDFKRKMKRSLGLRV